MSAYEADQPKTGQSLVSFYKTLIQLYLLRSFLYSFTYCIKEVIKGRIFWILNEKSAGLCGRYGLKQGNPLQSFQNTNKKLYVLCTNYFNFCIINCIKGQHSLIHLQRLLTLIQFMIQKVK